MTNIKTNEKRRKVLKTAGVATVAAGAWHKPVLNSVVTPAHAQTSEPVAMISGAGASSTSPPDLARLNKSQNNNLVDNAIEALVPSAQAGLNADEVAILCPALSNFEFSEGTGNIHCVSLTFPNGTDRNGDVMVSVSGPPVYYGYQCSYPIDGGYAYSYQGTVNLGGSDIATMNDGEFMVSLNDVDVFGSIDGAFENAAGTLLYTGPEREIGTEFGGYSCAPNANEGAYWAAELSETGGVCTPGEGLNSSIIVINSDRCEP